MVKCGRTQNSAYISVWQTCKVLHPWTLFRETMVQSQSLKQHSLIIYPCNCHYNLANTNSILASLSASRLQVFSTITIFSDFTTYISFIQPGYPPKTTEERMHLAALQHGRPLPFPPGHYQHPGMYMHGRRSTLAMKQVTTEC